MLNQSNFNQYTTDGQKQFFYISGVPASGKSTFLGKIEDKFDSKIQIIPEFLEPFPKFVNDAGKIGLEQRIAAQKWAIDQHAKKTEIALRSPHDIVVMERGIIDALAYSWALGEDVYSLSIEYANRYNWMPGNVLLLDAPAEVIKSRFMSRDAITGEDWASYWEPYMKKIREGFIKAETLLPQFSFHRIDTNHELKEGQEIFLRNFETLLSETTSSKLRYYRK